MTYRNGNCIWLKLIFTRAVFLASGRVERPPKKTKHAAFKELNNLVEFEDDWTPGESWNCSTETHQREGGKSTKPTGSDDHNQSCIWPSLVLSLMFWRVHCFRVDKALRTGVTSPYSLGACSSSNCRDAYEQVLLHWWTCCRKLWCTRQIQELCANV